MDYGLCYIGKTGRKVTTGMCEHKLATRHVPLSLTSVHEDRGGHKFNVDNGEILNNASTRHAREFLDAQYSSNNSVNRHIQMNHIYNWMIDNSAN